MGAKRASPSGKKTALPRESVFERAKEWAATNTTTAVGAGVAIVLAAIIVYGIVLHVRSKEARARAEYALISSRLPREAQGNAANWEKAIPVLTKFISYYPDSPSALDARIELAKGYFETKNYAKAVEVGEEALKAAPGKSGLKPLILYQLGYACEAAGKPEEAAKMWKALKQLGAPALEREADWNLGRIYQAKKQLNKAVTMYELALAAPGDYPSNPQINERLAAIKTAKKK